MIAVYARARDRARARVDLAHGRARDARRAAAADPRVVLFGSQLARSRSPFPAEDLGVVPPRRLAQLYRDGERRRRLLAHHALARRRRR